MENRRRITFNVTHACHLERSVAESKFYCVERIGTQ